MQRVWMLWCYCTIWYSIAIIIQKHPGGYGNITEMNQKVLYKNSQLFKSKVKITEKSPDDDNTKNVEIAVQLKCSS